MAGPKLFRNTDVTDSKGQFKQEALRYWEQIKTRAYDALPGFSKLAVSSDVDVNADYLVMRDTSEGVDVKVLASAVAPGPPNATLIETVTLTSGASQDSATIDVAALKADGYRNLVIRINGVSISAGSVLRMQLSDDDGSTWTPGSEVITGSGLNRNTTTLTGIGLDAAGLTVVLDPAIDNDGAFTIMDFSQANTSFPKTCLMTSDYGSNKDSFAVGHVVGIAAINKLRFETPSGTFDGTGSAVIYAV